MKKQKPIMKMVTQGRRSYGEDWQEITIGIRDDEVAVIENIPTTAPAGGKPIYVPAMGNLSMEQVDFLIEGARKAQEYGSVHPSQMPLDEYKAWLNEQWQDYVEQKLKWLKGQTTLGPAGFNQRETP